MNLRSISLMGAIGALVLAGCATSADEPSAEQAAGAPAGDEAATGEAEPTGDTFPEPGREIRIVVPYGTGGGLDTAARGLAPLLSDELGASIIVENRPGAGGREGATHVFREEGNSHVMLVDFLPGRSIGEIVFDADFEALAFQALYGYAQSFSGIAVAADSPIESIDDLIAEGPVTFAHPGVDSPAHLQVAILDSETDLDFNFVPYDGMGDASLAIASGEVDAGIIVAEQVAANEDLRAISVIEGTTDVLPGVPGLAGALGTEISIVPQIAGFFSPPGVEEEALGRLSDALGAVITSEAWADFGQESGAFTPTDVPRAELESWARTGHELVKEYGAALVAE